MNQLFNPRNQHIMMRKDPTPDGLPARHANRVYDDLRRLGAVWYDMQLPETSALPKIIHLDEKITGVVYGRYRLKPRYPQDDKGPNVGRGMLVATEKRLLFIDKKPMYLRNDEVPHNIISGITYSRVWPAGTVILHTRAGDFFMRTFNNTAAENFVEAVEATCFKLDAQYGYRDKGKS